MPHPPDGRQYYPVADAGKVRVYNGNQPTQKRDNRTLPPSTDVPHDDSRYLRLTFLPARWPVSNGHGPSIGVQYPFFGVILRKPNMYYAKLNASMVEFQPEGVG